MKNAKKGQGMVEYLGAVLVAAAIVVGLIALAPGTLSTLFNSVFSSVTTDLGVQSQLIQFSLRIQSMDGLSSLDPSISVSQSGRYDRFSSDVKTAI